MIGFDSDDVKLLRCPSCKEVLDWKGTDHEDGTLHYGILICQHHHTYRVESDIPRLYDQQSWSRKDQFMDVLYDFLAPVHDLSVSYVLPLIQYPDKEPLRANYMKALELDKLRNHESPTRILEVGSGTGANFPLIKHGARSIDDLEIWAVDLNGKMINHSAYAYKHNDARIRLAQADAHNLPFADNTFDRVLHVGGINIYRDASQGLAEMARVAKSNTPIVVVDEALDESRENNPMHRLAFFLLTSLDEFTNAPTELVPADCEVVSVENASRFYYCMTYQKTA